ncbi:MAG: hypothetical protein IJO63_04930 [Bacilli bacterium]|nr:hypothetical protein [Bacilli bacterium]
MKKFICIIILIISLVFLYAKYIEPKQITIHEYSVTSEKIPNNFDGVKIAHFSDILYTEKTDDKYIEKVINEIKNTNSDIVVFTGGLINKKINDSDKENLINLLSSIKPKLYKYAITGDKDSDASKEILNQSNFILLDNTSNFIFNNDTEPILIAGGDNLTSESLPEEEITYNYKIALIHKPDDYDKLNNDYNLVLAGHSLAGEIRLPFIGATIKKDGANKYTDTLYFHEDSYLYISNGIGSQKTGLRLLNTPSINVYRLYSK